MTQPNPDLPFHRLGPADIPLGQFRDYKLEENSILVSNCDGNLYAIEDRCTHDDGPLAEGRLYGCEIECPRHGAKFDLKTGKATALPAFNPVTSYPLRVVDGQIEIQLVKRASVRFEDPRGGFSF